MKCLASTRIYFTIASGLSSPISFIREIAVLCMGEREIPYLRLWSH